MRAEGERLLQDRRLQLLEGDRWSIATETHGAEGGVEATRLDRLRNSLRAECSCDTWMELGACPHIWGAAVLAARYGYLQGYGSGRLYLADRPDPTSLFYQPPAVPAWKQQLLALARLGPLVAPAAAPVRDKSLFYCLKQSYADRGFALSVAASERKLNGEWGKLREGNLVLADLPHLPAADQEIIGLISGNRSPYNSGAGLVLSTDVSGRMLEHLLKTVGEGQLLWGESRQAADASPVKFDDGPAWRFELDVARGDQVWEMRGLLRRGEAQMGLSELRALTLDGFIATKYTIARVEAGPALIWARELRARGGLKVPEKQGLDFARELLEHVPSTEVAWPEELRVQEVRRPLSPHLRFRAPKAEEPVRGVLTFHYEDQVFDDAAVSTGRGLRELTPGVYLARDVAAEQEARQTLKSLGLKPQQYPNEVTPLWEVTPKRFPGAVLELVKRHWVVESEGRLMRPSTGFKIEVSSGIDWFGLKGTVQFGDQLVELPELLKALEKGKSLIRLGDGSFGMLPDDFLKRYGLLLEMGTEQEGEVRYERSQASLLDVFLAEMPEIGTDELFEKARLELRQFTGIKPRREPKGFRGTLRDYQRAGLGWMDFLRRFGFGGCLADDMGVGKTPQVLAQLEWVRGKGTSLAVVPRSLIYNWKEEAKRFTPSLRVLDYSDPARKAETFENYDLVLTTYGILRRDVVQLREHEFEYVILDEAQAIKNALSESAKAARLLRARHRLALSGTPIENHLGELWSLFEFLNPGMLGASRVFSSLAGHNAPTGDDQRKRIAQAIKPFILRRTKQQVARELPERIEQTIYCELDAEQQKLYNELREHYRLKLLGKVAKGGLAKAKLMVLEALLRLRQAACHPGLIDKEKYGQASSAKLDSLMDNIEQVRDEGHKVLVFSQFTSMLALVRERLNTAGIAYCYLDGKTKDRQAVVENFQSAGGPGVFLISLKAGGVGLNLTAAEYVFLLDPWWNPAAEAQAIDRAHRIGQARTVFAYRLIAKGTVEERVLELQAGKRELAEAILGEDKRLIGNLSSEDLELLLS